MFAATDKSGKKLKTWKGPNAHKFNVSKKKRSVVHVSTTRTPCHKNIRLQQTMVFFPITNAGWAYRNPRSDRPVYRRVIVVAPIGGCGSEVFASLISCEHWEVKTYIQRTAAVKLLTMDMTSVDVQGSPHVKLHRVCICIAAHIHKRCFEHGKHPDRSFWGISHCCASVYGCFGGGNPCGGGVLWIQR